MRDSHQQDSKGGEVQSGQATARDYQEILELQRRYYVGNLSPDRRTDGFLSAEFTYSQIEAMALDLGIVVARSDGRVVGYMCASRLDLTPRPPILDSMLQSLKTAVFQGGPLSEAAMFVYGPVCIDEAYRGSGLLEEMFGRFKALLEDRFEVGVAFVADDNPRSLAAHLRRLSMEKIAAFSHGGKDYHAIAFSIR